jgi:hypothetical protein
VLAAGFLVALAACGDDAGLPGPFDAEVGDADVGDAAVVTDAGPDAGAPDLATCPDDDGDGVASAACGGGDCDDADPTRYPGATEVCDGDDEDCDDATLGPDEDGDGDPSTSCCDGTRCGADCDDARPDVNPGATEICNGNVDDDCDGVADAADGVCVPCAAGYVGVDGACVDVDECAVAGFCGTGAAGCVNTPGSFVCGCAAGYVAGSAVGGTCVNVDECAAATNPCGPGTCRDNAGSYLCACPAGFRAVSAPAITCVDVDECRGRLDDCDTTPEAVCRNTVGGFTCTCPLGFEGEGRGLDGCADIDECARGLDDCDDGPDACRNIDGGFECACPAGFEGDARGPRGCLFADPSLSALFPGTGAVLGPALSPDVNVYDLALAPGTTATTLTARAGSADGVTIALDGVAVTPGVAVPITIDDFAPRILTIVVTTESGATRTYTITVRRRSLYVKASNTGANDVFGAALALSADGSTLAVGAEGESSDATGVGGSQSSNDATSAGAVYVYRRNTAGVWAQEAYVKSTNSATEQRFGAALALSGDGSVLAIGARNEASAATGIDGDASDTSAYGSGAVYVLRRSAMGVWAHEAYVKASNPDAGDLFGTSLSLSADGATFVVGAFFEGSAATGIGGDDMNDAAPESGAVYVFRRSAGRWSQEAYVKASNAEISDSFGRALAISGDGSVFAVGASNESSPATGIGGDGTRNTASGSGAVYVFRRGAFGAWAQEVYVKASNTADGAGFGASVALSFDGSSLAVGASGESSSSSGLGAAQTPSTAYGAGAAYLFSRTTLGVWSQTVFIKAPNAASGDNFGHSIALSDDGATLAVGARNEGSAATGIGGDSRNDDAPLAGAVYTYRRSALGVWSEEAYVKASNTDSGDTFGDSVALSGDGRTLAVGAQGERSVARGVGVDDTDNGSVSAGAVYVY